MDTIIFYAVVEKPNGTPLAMFQYETWAEKWKEEYSSTSTIEEYKLAIKS